MADSRNIAYFSMEIGLESALPTYAGGLGILAGDTIRSAADLNVPMVAVTLVHRKGYFLQTLDSSGWQHEQPVAWNVADFLQEMPPRVAVTIEGRTVQLRGWQHRVRGSGGYDVPVYFLDADLPENSPWDRALTDFLYGGDSRYRLAQEIILGIGGVRLLRALGHTQLQRYHMNEGHSSLLTLELLDEVARQAGRTTITHDDVEAVRKQCVFTTHTPVPAGHDRFPIEMVLKVLGRRQALEMKDVFCCDNELNLTFLALNLSHYVNGVAKRHGEISRLMFAHYIIDAITNGVHAGTWVAEPFQKLFDRYIPGWQQDNFSLRYALSIPRQEVWDAHTSAKQRLIDFVNHQKKASLDADSFTIGFARRATAYKRADLVLSDLNRLRGLARQTRPLQLIYAGKAHPQDNEGKKIIQSIIRDMEGANNEVRLVYLENYDMDLAKLITAGVDLWLNTPQAPLEASGTSGMKAALNGVPSLSILDGWWLEGCIEGVTGWSIGGPHRTPEQSSDRAQDAAFLYDQLEKNILPLFYRERDRYLEVMRHSIALNGSFFNTHRMVQQYVVKAYFE